MHQVVINGRYLDEDRLVHVLKEIFPEAKGMSMKFTRGHWVLTLPRQLTEEETARLRRTSHYRTYRHQNEAIHLALDDKNRRNGSGDAAAALSDETVPDSTFSDHKVDERTTNAQKILGMLPKFFLPPHCGYSFPVHLPAANSTFRDVKVYSDGHHAVADGLHGVKIESGETSDVFIVNGEVERKGDISSKSASQKLAIKRLHGGTTQKYVLSELEALQRVESLHHPNIVEVLSAFQGEEAGMPVFIFAFPLALSNLKRLFRDETSVQDIILSRKSSLWSQFIGLASAVAFLHGEVHTSHRDIKPSNILIYADTAGGLILKLTDFGLAIDLTNALTWQEGSAAALSAWNYDSPEMKEASSIPSPQQLLANDIWKLGCVFTELAAFMVGGSAGVSRFMDSITTQTGNFVSDQFHTSDSTAFPKKTFDDGKKVKSQVIDAIANLGLESEAITSIRPLLCAMLERAPTRPNAQGVCQYLLEHTSWADCRYHDGIRAVDLVPWQPEKRSTTLDQCRLKVERFVGGKIDWSPFPPIAPIHLEGQFKVAWHWGSSELSTILSRDEMHRYIRTCTPMFRNGGPILPTSQRNSVQQSGTVGSQSTNSQVPPVSSPNHATPNTISTASSGPQMLGQPQTISKEVYWCLDEVFSEPEQTMRRPIILERSITDESFYLQTNQALSRARGNTFKSWILPFLSWKRCVGVEFTEFHVLRNDRDQVVLSDGDLKLPPSSEKEYEHDIRSPEDVHMRLAAVQMVAGLASPQSARGETDMVDMLPRKRIPPSFEKRTGTRGWGLHARMGLSVKRILRWLVFCLVAMFVFAAVWLSCINSTDLQNAFMPATIVLTIFTIILGVAQQIG